MRTIRSVCLAGISVAVFCPASVRAGDAAKAKRDLSFVEMSVESQRWNDAIDKLKQAYTDMEGLSDAEKAPLLTSIAEIKSGAS